MCRRPPAIVSWGRLAQALVLVLFPVFAGRAQGRCPVAGGGVVIDHSPVGCVVAAQFPRFDARFDPADEVAEARVCFRPRGRRDWYSVVMQRRGATFTGILPKPKENLEGLDYYIEAIGRDLESSRTEEYSPQVVAGAGACQGKKVAAVLASASVVITPPLGLAGAPLVPAGFLASGVAAAGAPTGTAAGGASVTKLAMAGGVVAATVAVVALQSDDPPTPTPTPLQYIVSGDEAAADAPFEIDDELWLLVNAGFVGAWGPPQIIGPARFLAHPGDRLTVQAVDTCRGAYRVGPLWLHRSGVAGRLLTGGVPACSVPSVPCLPIDCNAPPRTFFQSAFELP